MWPVQPSSSAINTVFRFQVSFLPIRYARSSRICAEKKLAEDANAKRKLIHSTRQRCKQEKSLLYDANLRLSLSRMKVTKAGKCAAQNSSADCSESVFIENSSICSLSREASLLIITADCLAKLPFSFSSTGCTEKLINSRSAGDLNSTPKFAFQS